ncbi:MAG: aldehyde ferredoxin oxidoreductase N-terminal domain-containing protein, partial [Acidimicrobiia bacterium]
MNYADRFLGGRGLAAKIYWDEVPPQVKPFDPENRLIFTVGPLAGFSGLAGSRWQVAGKSPTTTPEQFSYCNLGGHWGAHLKFAGYDGIIVQGQSSKPVYLFIEDGVTEVRDASALWLKGAVTTRDALKQELGDSIRVVATGPAGDNMVRFATLQADHDASGSCGFGAVMGSKKLKAIAVRGSHRPRAAEPEKLREVADYVHKLARRTPGRQVVAAADRMKKDYCWGCIPDRGCQRQSYTADDGTRGKFMCQSGVFYQIRAARHYGEWNEVPFQANRLCDDYGVDTGAIECMIMWLLRCMRAGILTDEGTGIPISKLGSLEFVESLVKKVAFRDGFGDTLAQGTQRAAELVGQGSSDLITDYLHKAEQGPFYGAREYITTGLLYAMEPRQPIQQLHEICQPVMQWVGWLNQRPNSYVSTDALRTIAEKFWGSEIAADFSTYEGKALAAKKVQDCQYAKESLILCDFSWPLQAVEFSDDLVGDPSVESKLLSAVTGNEVDYEGLLRMGARVFNL